MVSARGHRARGVRVVRPRDERAGQRRGRARLIVGEGGEAEARAAALQRRDDLGRVVADDAESCVLRELLDDAAEGKLRASGARAVSRGAARRASCARRAREPRARACAMLVMLSASSRMMSFGIEQNIWRVEANSLIWSRTTSMPRSSEAFSSSTIDAKCFPYILCAHARIVDVLPVPAGP